MGTVWTSEKIVEYHKFMASFISTYTEKIDCADLALEGLVEFAYQNGLPVKFKYFTKGKAQYFTSPAYEPLDVIHNPKLHAALGKGAAAFNTGIAEALTRNVGKKENFKKLMREQLGAENVIDNTRQIEASAALAGDFLMMKRPLDAAGHARMGHTRVIYTMVPALHPKTHEMDYLVSWYQGTYPPEIPWMVSGYLSDLVSGVEEDTGSPLVYGGKPRAWNFESFEK